MKSQKRRRRLCSLARSSHISTQPLRALLGARVPPRPNLCHQLQERRPQSVKVAVTVFRVVLLVMLLHTTTRHSYT